MAKLFSVPRLAATGVQCEAGIETHRHASEVAMGEFFKLLAAGPTFFVSAWFLMLIMGAVSNQVGVRPFGYLTAMVVTIALWLAVAPAIGAIARGAGSKKKA